MTACVRVLISLCIAERCQNYLHKSESLRLLISCHNTENRRFNIKDTSGREMTSHAEIMKLKPVDYSPHGLSSSDQKYDLKMLR